MKRAPSRKPSARRTTSPQPDASVRWTYKIRLIYTLAVARRIQEVALVGHHRLPLSVTEPSKKRGAKWRGLDVLPELPGRWGDLCVDRPRKTIELPKKTKLAMITETVDGAARFQRLLAVLPDGNSLLLSRVIIPGRPHFFVAITAGSHIYEHRRLLYEVARTTPAHHHGSPKLDFRLHSDPSGFPLKAVHSTREVLNENGKRIDLSQHVEILVPSDAVQTMEWRDSATFCLNNSVQLGFFLVDEVMDHPLTTEPYTRSEGLGRRCRLEALAPVIDALALLGHAGWEPLERARIG